eukprot:CAMPEP_0170611070 /NCGR_PEP_ID=MMETSP0224-20130122/22995_1 /TAXON_ID=285029 /ORGANISM="Togula jolla, Strain CCCM 725" /LENGTH=179 /DNA_ID=CAMNT_0010936485 /DNA_START=309 /DNA_END=846 /DNA_ORIENTATION=+
MAVPLHHEDGEVAVGLLDAVVEHPDHYRHIVREVNHQLLVLLHRPEAVLVHAVCVVEEKVVFARQLDPAMMRVLLIAQSEDLASNGLECSHLLWPRLSVLNPQLERTLAVVMTRCPSANEGSISSIAVKSKTSRLAVLWTDRSSKLPDVLIMVPMPPMDMVAPPDAAKAICELRACNLS